MLFISFIVLAVLNTIFFRSRPDDKCKSPLKRTKGTIKDLKHYLKVNGPIEKDVVNNDQVLDSSKQEQYGIKSSCRMLKTLFNDKLYRFAFGYMFFGNGNLAAQAALLTEIFTSFGVSEADSTMYGA